MNKQWHTSQSDEKIYKTFRGKSVLRHRTQLSHKVKLQVKLFATLSNRVHTKHWKWSSLTFWHLFMFVFQDFPGSVCFLSTYFNHQQKNIIKYSY